MRRAAATARRVIEVWAPAAGVLALDDLDAPDGRRLRALTRDPDGTWWTSEAPAGRYWLVLDGDRIPNPRSTLRVTWAGSTSRKKLGHPVPELNLCSLEKRGSPQTTQT